MMKNRLSPAFFQELQKGSFTIEASLLMFVVLFVVMGVWSLFFHVHNRALLTCAAYESAICGSMAESSQEGTGESTAWLRSHLLTASGMLGGDNLRIDSRVFTSAVVTYEMNTRTLFGLPGWRMEVTGKAHVLRPVSWIRKTKAACGLIFDTDG